MLKRASEGLVVRYGEGAAKLEGAALSKFMNRAERVSGVLRQSGQARGVTTGDRIFFAKLDLAETLRL